MKPEDINVSETYYARLRVDCITSDIIYVSFLDMQHNRVIRIATNTSFARAISPSNAENGTEIAEPAPKYDPCRKFREGDIVEPCQVKGRWQSRAWARRSGIRCTVTSDEEEDGTMWVLDPDSSQPDCVEAVFFQLVTPVEAWEPYFIEYNAPSTRLDICRRDTGDNTATYWYNNPPGTYTQEEAKEAAEAECDRLNAEYRAQNAECCSQNAEHRKEMEK